MLDEKPVPNQAVSTQAGSTIIGSASTPSHSCASSIDSKRIPANGVFWAKPMLDAVDRAGGIELSNDWIRPEEVVSVVHRAVPPTAPS